MLNPHHYSNEWWSEPCLLRWNSIEYSFYRLRTWLPIRCGLQAPKSIYSWKYLFVIFFVLKRKSVLSAYHYVCIERTEPSIVLCETFSFTVFVNYFCPSTDIITNLFQKHDYAFEVLEYFDNESKTWFETSWLVLTIWVTNSVCLSMKALSGFCNSLSVMNVLTKYFFAPWTVSMNVSTANMFIS